MLGNIWIKDCTIFMSSSTLSSSSFVFYNFFLYTLVICLLLAWFMFDCSSRFYNWPSINLATLLSNSENVIKWDNYTFALKIMKRKVLYWPDTKFSLSWPKKLRLTIVSIICWMCSKRWTFSCPLVVSKGRVTPCKWHRCPLPNSQHLPIWQRGLK